MRTPLLLLLAALALACASAQTPSDDAAAPIVSLRYGWMPGLEAQVVSNRQRVEQSGEEKRERSVRMSYRMSTLANGENLRIQSSDQQFELGGELAQKAGAAEVMGRLLSLSPELLISPSGELVG